METSFGTTVNNEIYHQLGDRWYTAQDDPIALLRAESRARNPWIIKTLRAHFAQEKITVLDLGCGGGFLANELAQANFAVTGFDASAQSLAIAARYDKTASVQYLQGDANDLPFAREAFHAACAMDFLEHVDDPARIIAEAARVLRPQGLFFFHTFNRNFIAWLIGIKGVEWFVKNTPPNLHLHDHFIKPNELRDYCEQSGLQIIALHGLAPKIFSRAFGRLLLTGLVADDFAFKFTSSTIMGYIGVAVKTKASAS